MTAIAGVWGAGLPQPGILLDAMGPRAAASRSEFEASPHVEIACGHHAFRPGDPITVVGRFALALNGRLEAEDGGPLQRPGLSVIELYRRYGVSGFSRLRGDFALILWDGERRRLVCARDAIGARPLVYRHSDSGFAVSSEERGLAPLFGDEPLCDLRVAEFLAGMAPPADEGMRSSIRRILPGSAAIVTAQGIETEVFDRLAFPEANTDPPATQVFEFSRLMRSAVARRCAGEAKVDCFLSGGLDSSSLARLAATEGGGAVRTLSLIDTAHPTLTERPYIDDVIAGGSFEVRFREVGGYDPFAGAQDALVRHAGPVVAPNLLMMRPLYGDARQGAVLLDGHGGDEVVSKGVGRLHDLARAGRWLGLYRELKGVADLYGESAPTMLLSLYRAYGPGRHKLSVLVTGVQRLFGKNAAAEGGVDVLSPTFRSRSGIDAAIAARWRPRAGTGREAEHAMLLGPQQPYALEVLDREAQDAGVEARCPFWDRGLIDYSMSLPPSAKLEGGWTRLILRRAMADVLPSKVLWRRDKHDFSSQLRDGLRRSPVVSPAALEDARADLSIYLDVDRVLALRARLDDPDKSLGGQGLQTLWRVGLWSIWSEMQRSRPVP